MCGNGWVCFASFLAAPYQYQNFQTSLWKPSLHFSLEGDWVDPVNRENVGHTHRLKKKNMKRKRKKEHKRKSINSISTLGKKSPPIITKTFRQPILSSER